MFDTLFDFDNQITVDSRNKLNDLTNKEWVKNTKSVWKGVLKDISNDELSLMSVMYSRPNARDELKKMHPATFAEKDIEKLIKTFTKEGQTVLDPFLGVGSTLMACVSTKRCGVGIELSPKWAEIAEKRLQKVNESLFDPQTNYKQRVIVGDARKVIKDFESDYFDFIVTSPPYWNILHNDKGQRIIQNRVKMGLDTKYSDLDEDLGNIPTYDIFLDELSKVFLGCQRVLKMRKYMCVIISDIRNKGEFIPYHIDIYNVVKSCGLKLQGIIILVQDNKKLLSYGIPYTFITNIHHQYIMIFRKETEDKND